jgi:hypothetical protein
MSFFNSDSWWNTRYKIRSNIKLNVDDLLPGSESLCGVTLLKQPLADKIKSDYSDLQVVRHIDQNNNQIIPFYVIEEGTDHISVIFKAPEPILSSDNLQYYLYYCSKSDSRLSDSADILNKNQLDLTDFGQFDSNTRWTFQKPTIYWINNHSDEPNATAVFEFVGHKADFFFKVGPNFGRFEYQINSGENILVDSYSSVESESKIVTIETNKLGVNKIRFTILGQKNPASSSSLVELVRAEYHQVLIGSILDEEFYSEISNSFPIGS